MSTTSTSTGTPVGICPSHSCDTRGAILRQFFFGLRWSFPLVEARNGPGSRPKGLLAYLVAHFPDEGRHKGCQ